MDIAASVVAFVGIAGQLLQGVSTVYNFLSDVQDAPDEIQQLNAELNLLKTILESMITYPEAICGSKEAFDSVGVAMEMVQNQVTKLKELVVKYNIKSIGRRKLLWSNVNVAFRKKKFAKYILNLDRARKLLEMAQSLVESHTRIHQTQLLHTIHQDISILRNSYPATAAVTLQSTIASQEAMDRTKPRTSASAVITQDDESMHGNGSNSEEQVAIDTTQKILSKMDTCGSTNLPWLTESAMRKLMVGILEENRHIFSNYRDSLEDSGNPEVISSENRLGHPSHTLHRGLGQITHFTKSNDTVVPAVYHSPWIGTVRVMRKSTVKRVWNTKDQAFETQHRMWQTYIHLKPASWLSRLGVDLRLGTTRALYGSAKIESVIEPVRFVIIPDEAFHALHQGDITTVQKLLSDGKISFRDRDYRSGDGLFKIALRHFGPNFLPEQFEQDLPLKSRVVSTSLWFLSQGLTPDIQDDHRLLDDFNFLVQVREQGGDIAGNISHMERLLLEISTDASPIIRAKKLLLFAMANPDHTLHLESVIWDLLEDEAPSEAELILFENTEREWWANGDLFTKGMASMLLNSYFSVRRESQRNCEDGPPSAKFEGSSKAPRRFLLGLMGWDQSDSLAYKDQVDHTANILRLSNKIVPILDDGFADHVSSYACRYHRLGLWHDILHSALPSATSHVSRHVTNHPIVQHPLRIMLGIENGSDTSATLLARDPHASKDENFDDLWESIESYSKSLYDSNGAVGNPPDICLVRQEGTELHFDCAVTDPQFYCKGHWEAERRYWSEFDEANRRYTHKEFTEEETQAVESPSTPTPGLLSRLVSEGASIITSIV